MSRELNEKEVMILLENMREKKKEKRKMKTGKKALYAAYIMCAFLLVFTMVMIYQGKDTTSLVVLATAGVGVLPIMYKIYSGYNTQINLKHMEMDYIPNYDEQEGIY